MRRRSHPARYLLLACTLPLVLLALTILGAILALGLELSAPALASAVGDEELAFALQLSLKTSLLSLLLALLLGIPTGYLLSRSRFPGKALLETLLDLPMVTPPLVAGTGLLFLLGRSTPLGQGLSNLGLELLFSPAGIVLAQTYVAASIVVRSARAAFDRVDPDYAAMSWTLGLAPGWTFLLVEIPMAAPGLAAAAILGWARALGEFGATLMLAGATRLHTETLPMAVFLNIASGETERAVACALILLALAATLLIAMRLLAWAGKREATA